MLHAIAPVVGYLAPLVACFVLARRFAGRGRRGWAAYCTATGVVAPLITVAAFPAGDFRMLFAGGVLLWGWVSVMAAYLLTGRPDQENRSDEEVTTQAARGATASTPATNHHNS